MAVACLRSSPDGVVIAVRVAPRAARAMLDGVRDGRLIVRVNAPPIDGAANAAVCKLLAKAARLPASRVRVLRGRNSRDKQIELAGADLGLIEEILPLGPNR
ncbi:MAG: DUF167 domain-containing protein [Solirubrobacterales bacterium]